MDAEAFRNRAVLVTGGSGFLGSHLVRRLLSAGATVHALERPGSSRRRLEDCASSVTFWPGNVTEYATVLHCVRSAQPTAVVHLAGATGGRRFDNDWTAVHRSVSVNLTGTLHAIQAVAESRAPVTMLLRTGGLEEYGTGSTPYAETQREEPISPYSAGQVAATHFCRMLQRFVTFPVVTLRPALVYGPGQSPEFFIPSLISSCLRGARFEMTAGEQRRDLLYVDDLVDAVLAALTRPMPGGEIINIATGVEHRILDVAEEIVRLTGSGGILQVGAAPPRPADLAHLVGDPGRAEALLGWRARVGLQEGLERTVAWYRNEQSRERQ